MTKLLASLGIVLTAALAVAAVNPPSASAKYWTKSQNPPLEGAGWYDAKEHGVNCKTAKQVARKWTFEGQMEPGPGRWRCEYHSRGYELGVVNCKRDRGEVVKFKVGA